MVAAAPLVLAQAPVTATTRTVAAASPRQASAPTGDKTVWDEADKTAFGTARTRASNVWFTMQQGHLSEVFYPDLSTPSIRSISS